MGEDYLVAPAVLVQGQVLRNNLGVTLLSPEDITDDWAQDWNGVPVVVAEHPTQRGVPVSARNPEILDSRGVGYVYRARVERNGTAQLKAEVWLNVARAEEVPELKVIMERLRAGESVELSTGFATSIEESSGIFQGEQYDLVIHPLGADHLAIFADKVGACSTEDGCGLGVHRLQEDLDVPNVAEEERGKFLRIIDNVTGLLQRQGQNAKTVEPAPTHTPVDKGTGPESRVLLRRLKVLDMTNIQIGAQLGCSAEVVGQMERGVVLNPEAAVLAKLKVLADNAFHDHSDEERRRLLDNALESEFGGSNKFLWVEAVFSDQERVVFGLVTESLTGREEQMFQTNFAASEEGEITFSEPKEVTRRIVFEPVSNEGKPDMPDDKKGKKPADASATPAANAEPASTDGEPKKPADGADGAAPAAQEPVKDPATNAEPTPKKAPDGKGGDGKDEVIMSLQTQLKATQDALQVTQDAVATLTEITKPAIEERERERQALVEELAGNAAVPYDRADLEAKPLVELQKFQAMIRGEDYTGRGGPRVFNASNSDPQYAPPVAYHVKAQKKEGDE